MPKSLQRSLTGLFSVQNYNDLKREALVNLPKYGGLQGSIGYTAWTNRTIFQFLNVPYAESPSGNRRFKVFFVRKSEEVFGKQLI